MRKVGCLRCRKWCPCLFTSVRIAGLCGDCSHDLNHGTVIEDDEGAWKGYAAGKVQEFDESLSKWVDVPVYKPISLVTVRQCHLCQLELEETDRVTAPMRKALVENLSRA